MPPREDNRQEEEEIPKTISTTVILDEIKALYALAIPMILSGLLSYMKAAISMFFMGHLGKTTLAGGSLAIGVANITGYSFIFGLATGMEGISSQAYGAQNDRLLSHTLQRTIVLLISFSIPIAFLWFFLEPVLIISGQDSSISSMAVTYLRFSIPNLLFQSFIHPIKIYLRSQKVTRPLMISAAIAVAVHVPANYFAVNLGFKGIALVGCLTEFIILVTLVVSLFLSKLNNHDYMWFWRDFASFRSWKDWKPIVENALPSCLSVCLEWWWYEIMIVLAGILSNAADAVATMGLLIQMTALVYQFPVSLGQAVSTRVGNELGADNPKQAKVASLVALACAAFTGIIALCFMVALRNVWGGLFTSDPVIISLVATVLPVVGFCELGNCPQTTVCGVLRGSARSKKAANINFGSFYGVGLPAALVLVFDVKLGLYGLWMGLLVAQLFCFGLMVLALIRTDWEEQAHRALALTFDPLEQHEEGEERRRGEYQTLC